MQRVKVKVKGKRRCVNESMFFTIANGGKRKKRKEGRKESTARVWRRTPNV